jgi:hypothetical protein
MDATTIATGLAAVAALASWAGVWQSQRVWKASFDPVLGVQAISRPHSEGSAVTLDIHNFGQSPTRSTAFYAFSGTQRTFGVVPPGGVLKPGAEARLETDLLAPTGKPWMQDGVIGCLDVRGRAHVWNFDGDHKMLRRKWGRPKRTFSIPDALNAFYPEHVIEDHLGRSWRAGRPAS